MAKMKKTKEFFNEILLSDNPKSSKRFVTLIVTFHFILASFLILFLITYLIFYSPKGMVDINLLGILKDILEYDFYIMLGGLGFITLQGMTSVMIERAKKVVNPSPGSSTIESKEEEVKDI